MKALDSYFKKQANTIHLLLDRDSKSFTASTFHQLRVEIKRVKALVDLIAFCSKKWNPKKTFKPFKVIFKQAGKVREIQLQLALLEEQPSFNSLTGCRKHYKKKLKRALEKFFTVANSETSGKLRKKHRIIIARFLQIGKKKQRRYMAVKRQEIKKMLRLNTVKKKQIHTFRKRLKVYDYNEKIMKYPEQNKGIAARNKLMVLLGHWHDYQVSILQIKVATRSCASDSSEVELLENIKTKFISKRNLLFGQINSALKQQHFLDAEEA